MIKPIFSLLMAGVLLAACSSKEKTARSKIEEFVLKNADDPKSYEFIEMEKPDTFFQSESIKLNISLDSSSLKMENALLTIDSNFYYMYAEKVKDSDYGYIYRSTFEDYKLKMLISSKRVDSFKNSIKVNLDRLAKAKSSDKAISIEYTAKFRLKNSFGALKKSSASVVYLCDENLPEDKRWVEVQMEKINP
ncbi:MAG: hypothetical protein ACK5XN_18950 [Bacteroidota bacterium]